MFEPIAEKKVVRAYEHADELKELAEKIIKEELIDIRPARVAYLFVEPNISKSVPAKIVKATPEMNFLTDYDYVIEVSKDIFYSLIEEHQRILVLDQLLRILVVMNDKTGDYQFKLRQPDFTGFKRIIDSYGTEWKTEIRTIMSSVYQLNPAQEDKIKI